MIRKMNFLWKYFGDTIFVLNFVLSNPINACRNERTEIY